MYIQTSHYYEMVKRDFVPPRERYIQYNYDLHERYKMPLDDSTLTMGSQYNFADMVQPLFELLKGKTILQEINLMVAAYWSDEFDSDYTNFGPHVSNEYGFKCKMFDVLDQGSICSLTALFLVQQYLLNLKLQKALCVCLDQTTIPREDSYSYPIPDKAVCGALILNINKPVGDAINIVDIKLFTEKLMLDCKFNMLDLVIDVLNKNNISLSECAIALKRNTNFSKLLKLFSNNKIINNKKLLFLPNDYGCTSLFKFINSIDSYTSSLFKNYIVLIEEDVESFTTGLLILEIPH